MRGQEAIIRMRMERLAPAIVFVNDYPCLTDWEKYSDHATVCVFGDVIQTLDLRYVNGLRVSIGSLNEERARLLFEKCKAAGAELVGVCHIKPAVHYWDQDGLVEVWSSRELEHGRNSV